MPFHSQIVRGEVTHKRMGPTAHSFSYPYTFFIFDLDELPQLEKASFLFAHNHIGVLQVNDRDYLKRESSPIEAQLNAYIPKKKPGQRSLLISSPRYLGYAFNPVNFHLRLDSDDSICHAVAEVNNTFGDGHVYPLPNLESAADGKSWTARCPKDFHVSPFNDLKGEYRFLFRIEATQVFFGVDLYKQGSCVMQTWMRGHSNALNTANILKYTLLHPWDTALNSLPRITWQAAKLYYGKRLAPYKRPQPRSSQTVVDRDHPEPNRPII